VVVCGPVPVLSSRDIAGKEIKRKLEQGPLDHDIVFKCKVYENGRVMADPETLRRLAGFSEPQIRKENRVSSRHDPANPSRKAVKRSTYQKIVMFLEQQSNVLTTELVQ
jgi:hypothetical protein